MNRTLFSLTACTAALCFLASDAAAQAPPLRKAQADGIIAPEQAVPDGWTPWDDFLIGEYELLSEEVLFGGESLDDRIILVETKAGNIYHVALMDYADPSWIAEQCPRTRPIPPAGRRSGTS